MDSPYRLPLLFTCCLFATLPLAAQEAEKAPPAVENPGAAKSPAPGSQAPKAIVAPLQDIASQVLWLPSYTISKSNPEELAKKADKKAVATVFVKDIGASKPSKALSSSFKRNWPNATPKNPVLAVAWVVDGKITQTAPMRLHGKDNEGTANYVGKINLTENDLHGFPVIEYLEAGKLVAPAPLAEASPKEFALQACVADDAAALEGLLTAGLSPDSEYEPGLSLVAIAASSDSVQCLEVLKARGAKLFTKSEDFSSPLELAAEKGRLRAVEFLLANKVPTFGRAQKNSNALFRAAAGGHLEIVKALLKADANPNEITNHNETPVAVAINHNYPEIAALLFDQTNSAGRLDGRDHSLTFLTLCREGKTEMVRFFLSHKANPRFTEENESPLTNAAPSGSADLAKLLIQAGAKVNWQDETGATALFIASTKGNAAFVRELLAGGADANLRTKSGNTALHAAAFRENKEIMRLLLAAGANPEITNEKGFSALQICLLIGSRDCAEQCASAGAKLDFKAPTFERDLEAVIQLDLGEVLKTLLQGGLAPDYHLGSLWTLREAAGLAEAKSCLAVLDAAGAPAVSQASCNLVKPSAIQKDFKMIQGKPVVDPRPLEMNFPALKAKIRFLVQPDGSTHFVQVEDCPDSLVRLSIAGTASQWHFTPPVSEGKPVAVRVGMPLNFPSSKERRPEAPKIDKQPVAIRQSPPIYPRNALRQGGMAQVTVAFTVNPEGIPVNVRAIQTTGEVFIEPAVDCVKKWRFKPALAEGKPVPCDLQVPIIFSIENR